MPDFSFFHRPIKEASFIHKHGDIFYSRKYVLWGSLEAAAWVKFSGLILNSGFCG